MAIPLKGPKPWGQAVSQRPGMQGPWTEQQSRPLGAKPGGGPQGQYSQMAGLLNQQPGTGSPWQQAASQGSLMGAQQWSTDSSKVQVLRIRGSKASMELVASMDLASMDLMARGVHSHRVHRRHSHSHKHSHTPDPATPTLLIHDSTTWLHHLSSQVHSWSCHRQNLSH